MKTKSIPVIDINELTSPSTLEALDRACREWGFFQVTNHGIPEDAIERIFDQARAFFARPLDLKRRITRTKENPWGFYDRELTKNVRDLKQIYDFGPSDGRTMRPQWPAGMPAFQNAIHAYYGHCEKLSYRLLAAISTNLGMSPGYLSRGFGRDHTSFLRLNYYPVPLTPASTSDGHLGVGQHTDSGALTLLLQDEQPGLEVFHDNEWHIVEPRKDALVVNIGDIAQVWSNDRYFAALHRVIASVERERFSIPYFMAPESRTNYAPVPTMVSDAIPARYEPINWGEFKKLRSDGDYADLGEEVQIAQFRVGT
jgi:isopenicillin N synthase-like dioxygenase